MCNVKKNKGFLEIENLSRYMYTLIDTIKIHRLKPYWYALFQVVSTYFGQGNRLKKLKFTFEFEIWFQLMFIAKMVAIVIQVEMTKLDPGWLIWSLGYVPLKTLLFIYKHNQVPLYWWKAL